MLKHEDAGKSKGQVIEERDLWKARYEVLKSRTDHEVANLTAAFQRVLVEASLQGVKIGTSEAAEVIARKMAQA